MTQYGTTDDKCTHHATLAAYYQLSQSLLKIGFVLAKRVGWGVGGHSLQSAVHMAAVLAGCRRPWSTLARLFLSSKALSAIETTPLPF